MKRLKQQTLNMTEGSPTGLIIRFAVPMLIGNLFQQLYNMVDAMVVGNFVSANALAAVGACSSLNFLIFSLTSGMSVGIGVVISQFYGANDYENVRKSFATATYAIALISLVMGALGFLFSRNLLELLDTPAAIIEDSNRYLKICCLGILGNAAYQGMSSVMRALGDSVSPLIFLVVACIVNILLDFLFVLGFELDVPGVALATIIAQAVSGISCVLYALKKLKLLRMPLKRFVPYRSILGKCMRIGLPAAIQNSFVAVSTLAVQNVTNRYGEVVVAAGTAAARLEQLVLMPGMSLGMAMASYTGQNIGAGKIDRVKKGFRSGSFIIVLFSICMTAFMYLFAGNVVRLFTSEAQVIEIGVKAIRITSLFYIPVGMIYVSRNVLSGAGDMKIPMVMGISEMVTRVVFANVLTLIPAIGFLGIWWATGLNWLITGTIGCIRYATGKWKTKAIVG